ncbi:MAG: hypothetical protein COX62_08010 [Deltaproteobacteria bacterium CG_4_10_14_0_2_um_filter_43_8]|nr:MAG: hypothetical protein COX62_08010 [Deltaproteobacteria bacterium CG_4_10_14_0_2_um_filter_43_8]
MKIWWGKYELEKNQAGFWKIGPLSLHIEHKTHEWVVKSAQENDPLASHLECEVPTQKKSEIIQGSLSHFAVIAEDNQLYLSPMLADRPIITRPEEELYILPQEKALLYVSTPLWLNISLQSAHTVLAEIPLYRPSDTWFGENTLEGQLCYASKTFSQLDLSAIPLTPHRATTAVIVHNMTALPFCLKKLSLPTPYLSLFVSETQELWTESVKLEVKSDSPFAPLQLKAKPPLHVKMEKRICNPRIKSTPNLALRTFQILFGKKKEISDELLFGGFSDD